jgi:hypothetical protein
VKSQHVTRQLIREIERARAQVCLSQRSPRVPSLFPDRNRTLNTDVIVLAPRPLRRFAIHRHAVEPCSSQRIDAAVLLVAGLPRREAETFADIIFAGDRIVARERMNYKTPRRCWIKSDR